MDEWRRATKDWLIIIVHVVYVYTFTGYSLLSEAAQTYEGSQTDVINLPGDPLYQLIKQEMIDKWLQSQQEDTS